MGVNLDIIKKINNHILKSFKVDFTFLSIVNINNMQKRLKQRKKLNRYDKFKEKFYKKVQNGFLRISKTCSIPAKSKSSKSSVLLASSIKSKIVFIFFTGPSLV